MARSDDKLERAKSEVTGLESYRRLIELQKQMIELSQHHERSRRECDALRDVVAREVAEQMRIRQSPSARLRATATKLFKFSPLALARQLFS
jgi:phage-related tail protein